MTNILVTGVGGGVGQSILKALHGSGFGVVGVDSEELAAGLHAVSRAHKGRYAADPLFVETLLEIARQEGCQLIFPGHDVELLPISENAGRFLSAGITPVVSRPDVIRTCDDKLATNTFLKSHGFPVPTTLRLRDVAGFDGPVVLKPQRGGARSRQTYLARSPKELDIYRQLVDPDNCIVQEYIDGEEYTCGTVSVSGACAGVIVMRRTLRDGDTYKAFVDRSPVVESSVTKVVEALKPFGACNVQLRMRDGVPFVFEINARCSGTTNARALAGFNEPRMVADYVLNGISPRFAIREISILRYWNELAVSNERITQLKETGSLQGNGSHL